MTPHDHSAFVPGCFRCELSRDEVADQNQEFEPCPMGCGRTTEDPYGGPCEACWDAAPEADA